MGTRNDHSNSDNNHNDNSYGSDSYVLHYVDIVNYSDGDGDI